MTTKLIKEFGLPFKVRKNLTIVTGAFSIYNDTHNIKNSNEKYFMPPTDEYFIGGEKVFVYSKPEYDREIHESREFAREICKIIRYSGQKHLILTNNTTIIREFNTLLMMSRKDLPHIHKVREKFNYDADEYLNIDEVVLYVFNSKFNRCGDKVGLNFDKVKPDPKFGLDAYTFDETIIDMRNVQNALRFGLVDCVGGGENE